MGMSASLYPFKPACPIQQDVSLADLGWWQCPLILQRNASKVVKGLTCLYCKQS